MARHSSIFGEKHALRPHSVPRETEDLRNDVESTLLEMEGRGAKVGRVLSQFDSSRALPVNPTDGDRYLCSVGGNGWTAKHIYEYDGTSGHEEWVDFGPQEGMATLVDDEAGSLYIYQGGAWSDLLGDAVSGAEAAQAAAEAAQGLAEHAQADAEAAQAVCEGLTFAEVDAGVIQNFRLLLPEQPSEHDTIDVGSDTYEFMTSGGDLHISDPLHIGVLIGLTADDTRSNLVSAVNATNLLNQHASILKDDGGGGWIPALANGTEPYVASNVTVDNAVQFLGADVAGGTATPGNHSCVLGEDITHADDVWDCGEVNVNTLPGAAAASHYTSKTKFTVTQALLDAGGYRLRFPFAIVWMNVEVWHSGVKVARDEAVALDITAHYLEFTFADGGGSNFAAGDVVYIEVRS